MFCMPIDKGATFSKIYWQSLLVTAAVFFEQSGRAEEIAIWVLPRFLEMTWNYLKKKNIIKKEIPRFLSVVFALSVGAFCQAYMNNKSELKSKYSMLGRLVFGSELKEPGNHPANLRNVREEIDSCESSDNEND